MTIARWVIILIAILVGVLAVGEAMAQEPSTVQIEVRLEATPNGLAGIDFDTTINDGLARSGAFGDLNCNRRIDADDVVKLFQVWTGDIPSPVCSDGTPVMVTISDWTVPEDWVPTQEHESDWTEHSRRLSLADGNQLYQAGATDILLVAIELTCIDPVTLPVHVESRIHDDDDGNVSFGVDHLAVVECGPGATPVQSVTVPSPTGML